MKMLFIILFAILHCCNSNAKANGWDIYDKHKDLITAQGLLIYKPCEYSRRGVFNDFRRILYDFTINTFRRIASFSNSHFVYSPYSMWLTLAGVAEGCEDQAKTELFEVLELPEAKCVRKQFYQLAKSLEPPGEDVIFTRQSLLVLDQGVVSHGHWENFVKGNKLIQTQTAPLKSDSEAAAEFLRKTMSLQLPFPNFEGNSIVVDILDYNGLWSTAFAEAVVEKAPFYDDLGKRIGYVDLMKIRRRVRMAYIPILNMKVLELPVGFGERYKMLIALHLGTTQVRSAVPKLMETVFYDVLDALTESIVPIDVAIPRFTMTTEIDMRKVLEEIGIKSIWIDQQGTRNISDPAAFPSSFIERTTVTFDTTGVKAPILEVSNIVPRPPKNEYSTETGLDPLVGEDFLVDKPFYFGLFDSKTYSCLYCGIFSRPTYKL